MRLKAVLPILLIALVVIGAGAAFTLSSSASTPTRLTTPVMRGNVESTVLATGTLKPSSGWRRWFS